MVSRLKLVIQCVLTRNAGGRKGLLRSLGLESRATVARFSEPRERSDGVSVEDCDPICLNKKRRRPGKVTSSLGLESRATVARFSEPRERSDGVSVEDCDPICLNKKRRRPGKGYSDTSAWKAEQLLLGSPNRGNETTVSPLRLAIQSGLTRNFGGRG